MLLGKRAKITRGYDMVKYDKTIGIRKCRFNAGKLANKYLKSRSRKPYKVDVVKYRDKWAVKVKEKKW
tara:strand:- start:828 stop:1031 length:204 start_codon:yes stop_codon:yes gene_type:complete